MKKKTFYHHLAEIFETNVKNLTSKKKLSNYDWDSLKVLELISFADTHFPEAKISPDKINECLDIDDIEKLFKRYIN